MGAFGNFGTEGTGWSKKFPGITNYLLTLNGNFRLPLYKEYLQALGLASVSRRSCEALLYDPPDLCWF
jgi:2-acylglycerol O-acyltransferase 2